jgi:thiamine biosynthesis protein ThiS
MITAKDRQIDWHPELTIPQVLKALGYKSTLVLVRVNGETVAKKMWSGFYIPDGARVDIRPLMAGG